MQVDDGVFVVPLPEDYKDQRRDGDHGQRYDEIRFEPIVALPFIEDHLQGSKSERDETESGVIDASFTQFAALEIRRILNKPRRKQERENPNWDIDEENPAPGKIVGDPTAKRWTDCRSHHHRYAINGECHAPLGGSEGVGEDGLLARLQAATARTLKNAEDDQHGEIRGEPAQRRTDGEQRDTTHVKVLAPDDRREPTAQRQHDGVRDQIRRKHPGALVLTRGKTAG